MGISSVQRRKFYPECVEKQGGEYCKKCGLTPDELRKWGRSEPVLLLDHKDNNNKNNEPENHQLLCRSCNRIKNPHKPTILERSMTPEMSINKKSEPYFRNWLLGKIMEKGHVGYNDAVDSGAEECEVSIVTIKRYLRKCLSSAGMYELGWFQSGTVHIYAKGGAPTYDNIDPIQGDMSLKRNPTLDDV